MSQCQAAVAVGSERYRCDLPAPHPDLAHQSQERSVVWCGDEGPDTMLEDRCPPWCDLKPDRHWVSSYDMALKEHLVRCPEVEGGVRCKLIADHSMSPHHWGTFDGWRD